jgi:hypothetical protein
MHAAQASSKNGAAAVEQDMSSSGHFSPIIEPLVPPLRVQNGRPVLQVPAKPTEEGQTSVNGVKPLVRCRGLSADAPTVSIVILVQGSFEWLPMLTGARTDGDNMLRTFKEGCIVFDNELCICCVFQLTWFVQYLRVPWGIPRGM